MLSLGPPGPLDLLPLTKTENGLPAHPVPSSQLSEAKGTFFQVLYQSVFYFSKFPRRISHNLYLHFPLSYHPLKTHIKSPRRKKDRTFGIIILQLSQNLETNPLYLPFAKGENSFLSPFCKGGLRGILILLFIISLMLHHWRNIRMKRLFFTQLGSYYNV